MDVKVNPKWKKQPESNKAFVDGNGREWSHVIADGEGVKLFFGDFAPFGDTELCIRAEDGNGYIFITLTDDAARGLTCAINEYLDASEGK